MIKCDKCGINLVNKGSYVVHYNSCKLSEQLILDMNNDYDNGLSLRKLEDKYNITMAFLVKCIKNKRSVSEASKLAHKSYPDRYLHSEESKDKIRQKRLEFMEKNPEKTAWRKSNMSYPESIFYKWVSEQSKYVVEREKSFFPYFADFAIMNAKVVIEIDGSQHLLKERKVSDSKKDELIKEQGWRVLRVPAAEIINNFNIVINDITNFIDSNIEVDSFTYVDRKQQEIFQKSKESEKKLIEKERIKTERISNIKNRLLLSDIDFSKFGWVTKASFIIGIKPQKVGRWMQRNMKKFYEEKCFKR